MLMTGCSTFQRLGITEDIVKTGVKLALVKYELEGAVTDAQIDEIITIVKAEQRLQEIGEEIAEDQRIQAKIEEIVGRYVIGGEVIYPRRDEESAVPNIDDAPWDEFGWTYGKENKSAAVYDGSVIIRLEALKANKIDLSWEKDLSAWGAAHDDHRKALACAFLLNDQGKWVGGKFDWISSSRTDRGFAHFTSYEDWTLEGIPNPTTLAFVVVEANGKRRSNVIAAEWKR